MIDLQLSMELFVWHYLFHTVVVFFEQRASMMILGRCETPLSVLFWHRAAGKGESILHMPPA